jgi:hypothetical protein
MYNSTIEHTLAGRVANFSSLYSDPHEIMIILSALVDSKMCKIIFHTEY